MDESHAEKCTIARRARTDRHNEIVSGIIRLIPKGYHAREIQSTASLESGLKPDILFEKANVTYIIDVKVSIDKELKASFKEKKEKYKEIVNGENHVIPIIIAYNGVIMKESMQELMDVIPDIEIDRIYKTIYKQIAWTHVKANDVAQRKQRKMIDDQEMVARTEEEISDGEARNADPEGEVSTIES